MRVPEWEDRYVFVSFQRKTGTLKGYNHRSTSEPDRSVFFISAADTPSWLRIFSRCASHVNGIADRVSCCSRLQNLQGRLAVRCRKKVFAINRHHRFTKFPGCVFQSERARCPLNMELIVGERYHMDRHRIKVFRKGRGNG